MVEKAKIDTGVEGDCASTTDGVDPNTGFKPLGEHDPCEHDHAYVDGDTDDYSKGDTTIENPNEEDDD